MAYSLTVYRDIVTRRASRRRASARRTVKRRSVKRAVRKNVRRRRTVRRRTVRRAVRKYPRCFEICRASQQIYDLAKKLKATGNPLVKALVAHHSAILCVEKAVAKNRRTCATQRRKLARFAKLKPTASWNAIFKRLHNNMTAAGKKIAKILTKEQLAEFVKLQTMFEKIHFKEIKQICRK